jgi:hypothetical protein
MIRKLPGVGDIVRFKFRNGEAWVEKEGKIYEVLRLSTGRPIGYKVQSANKRHTILMDLVLRNYEERKVSSIYP